MNKKLFYLMFLLLLCGNIQRAFAQVPKEFVYQVMVLDPKTHAAMPNHDVKIRIEIRKGSSDGDVVWTKDYDARTNEAGACLLTVDVKDDVEWNRTDYYLATFVDGVLSGCTKITAVPYALLSDKAIFSMIAANAYLANVAHKTDSAKYAINADTAQYSVNADTSKYALKAIKATNSVKADTALNLDGIITPEELIGKWEYDDFNKDGTINESEVYVFNSDGTGLFNEYISGKENDSYSFTWKLNKAGILYIHETNGNDEKVMPLYRLSSTEYVEDVCHYYKKNDGTK